MKIAIPTDDGKTIAGHTGHAKEFMVITFQDEKVVNTELRKNPKSEAKHHEHAEGHEHGHDHGGGGCGCGNNQGHEHNHDQGDGGCCGGNGHGEGHGHDHGHDHGSGGCGCGSGHSHEIDEAHLSMAKSIGDCEFFVLKHLGGKLAAPLQKYDIRPVMVRGDVLANIDDIVKEFVAFSKANNVPV